MSCRLDVQAVSSALERRKKRHSGPCGQALGNEERVHVRSIHGNCVIVVAVLLDGLGAG